MAYSEFRFWSPLSGRELVRISMSDERGSEFFTFVPSDAGRNYRVRREEALVMIEQAIRAGLEPGEVRAVLA